MLPIMTSAIDGPEDNVIISEFFQKHKLFMYAEAWRYLSLHEDVEDIVYEALVRIIDRMDKFRTLLPHERVQYAKAVIRNLSYTYTKRQSLYTMVPFEDVDTYLTIEESQLPESVALRHIKLEHLRNMWAKLPVEDRLLLEQKYVLDWSDAELAASLGIKPQSVRMRLTRAKRNAIHHLKEQGFQISDWL
ncbi:MAG: sigma-70 family RNA polymerase sigma factor [Oscillospiraceae bacterium]|nr:sigma-70 family RNA polymerase sigma factor [Oscillospiraceae bacterium]